MRTESVIPYLEIKGVCKEYPVPRTNPFKPAKRFSALNGVDLAVPEGAVSCILGPNGAGKTTLIKIIAGLILPDKGEIRRGNSTGPGQVGMVTPNDRSFYWRLTGRQNLEFFAALYNLKKGDRVIDSVLKEVGLEKDADKPFRQYSAGMKQKLNIARALLSDPPLYLLDEPANHLDPLARENFRNFVREVLLGKRGATVVLCTHDLEEASELADSLALLNEGKILAQGDPELLKVRVRQESSYNLKYSVLPEIWMAENKSNIIYSDDESVEIRAEREEMNLLLKDFLAAGGKLEELTKTEPRLMDVLKYFMGENNG